LHRLPHRLRREEAFGEEAVEVVDDAARGVPAEERF
jgi:hypothetical protein